MKLSSTDLLALTAALHQAKEDPRFIEFLKLSARELENEKAASELSASFLDDLNDRLNAESLTVIDKELVR